MLRRRDEMARARERGIGRRNLSPFLTVRVEYVELVEEARDGAVERLTAEEEQFFPVWRSGQGCVCADWRRGGEGCFSDFEELRLLSVIHPSGICQL